MQGTTLPVEINILNGINRLDVQVFFVNLLTTQFWVVDISGQIRNYWVDNITWQTTLLILFF